MKKGYVLFILGVFVLSFSTAAGADDVVVKMDSETGSGFVVQDSGGAEKVRITSDGKVGIGTPEPTRKLSVNGYLGISGGHIITDSGYGIYMGNNKSIIGHAALEISSNNGINFRPDGSNLRLKIDTAGNVGIGTNNPEKTLSLNHADYVSILMRRSNVLVGEIGEADQVLSTGGTDKDLGIRANLAILFATGGQIPTMKIDKDGNVGIGTTSPTSNLEVNGSMAVAVNMLTSGAPYTITAADNIVLCDGCNSVTLPAASGIKGRIYTIKNVFRTPGVNVTVYCQGTDYIENQTTTGGGVSLARWDTLTLVSDGVDHWYKIFY